MAESGRRVSNAPLARARRAMSLRGVHRGSGEPVGTRPQGNVTGKKQALFANDVLSTMAAIRHPHPEGSGGHQHHLPTEPEQFRRQHLHRVNTTPATDACPGPHHLAPMPAPRTRFSTKIPLLDGFTPEFRKIQHLQRSVKPEGDKAPALCKIAYRQTERTPFGAHETVTKTCVATTAT